VKRAANPSCHHSGLMQGFGKTLAGMILTAAIAAAPAHAVVGESGDAGDGARVSHVHGEVIVQFDPSSAGDDRADARGDAETSALEGLGSPGLQLVEIEDGSSVAETIRELEADPAVRHASPNLIREPHAIPNDTRFGELWGLNNTGQQVFNAPGGTADADIDAPAAWDINTGDPGTVVAVMDTGADLAHADLAPQLWQNPGEIGGNGVDDDANGFVDDVSGFDFVTGDPDPSDALDGHGTHTAGTALARGDDGFGVTGVSQRASLMVLRVCAPGGCQLADEIQAINYAGNNGADVLNGSLGGLGSAPPDEHNAIFSHPGTLFVFSAGNGEFPPPLGDGVGDDNEVHPIFPCNHAPDQAGEVDNVICVAATTQTDARAGFSNFGAVSVDLGAPGTDVLSGSIFQAQFRDTFEVNNFATNWLAGGWVRSNQAPLNSFGITDNASGNYNNNVDQTAQSQAVTIPAGFNSCRLRYFRSVQIADDLFNIIVRRNTVPIVNLAPADGALGFTTRNLGNDLAAGGNVDIQLRLQTNAAVTDSGVHLDNIEISCIRSPSNDHQFLNGTSMAAPHVAGAAALLFSRNPGATPAEVREKLLTTVDPNPALAGITVTGGRLNIGSAMAAMPADTSIAGGPEEGSELGATSARRGSGAIGASATFSFNSNDPAASFQCAVDGAAFGACSTPGSHTVTGLGPGSHTFAVRSIDPRGNADTSPSVRNFAVESDPPETRIRKGPKKRTGLRKAKFRFSSDEPGSTFECRIDKKKFKPCRSPRKIKRLKAAKHKFLVRATDQIGNTDPSPARKRWRVTR